MAIVGPALVLFVLLTSCSSPEFRPSELSAVIESADSFWVGGSDIALQFEIENSGGPSSLVDVAAIGGLELVEAQWSSEARSVGPAIEGPSQVGLPVEIPADSNGHLYLHWTVLNCAGLGTQEVLDSDGGVLFSIDQVPLEVTVADIDDPAGVDATRVVAFDASHHPNQHVVALYELGSCG